MSDPLKQPLHGVAVYNPDLLNKAELIGHFVARRPLLDRLLEDLRRDGARQHHLLVGQRGMGKTTLLRRLRYAIEDDPEIARRWLPLTFPEEQYNVARLSDLYLNCIDALGDTLEEMDRHEEAAVLDQAVEKLPSRDEPERARRALDLLLGTAHRLDRGLVLLIDNVELIFERLKEHQWTLRKLLSAEPRLLLIGASASMVEATYKYDEPFYDFFLVHELRGLSEADVCEVLRNLARLGDVPAVERLLDEDPVRFRTLGVLAGGNPRTVVLLFGVLAQGTEGDVRSDLERLLDQCTPLYKARFEALPAQMQQIVHAMAIHWDPLTAAELAAEVRLETKAVSAQLNRLSEQGVVEKVEYHPSAKAGYQIAERFFNIWYLMRASRRVRKRLIWLVEFLKLFHGQAHLRPHAQRHLRGEPGTDAKSRLRHAEYSLALADAIEEKPLRRALESEAVQVLTLDRELRSKLNEIIDLEGADASLKPIVDKHAAAVELRELIMGAKVDAPGWNATEFHELLSSSLSRNLAEKRRIVSSLESLSPQQIHEVTSGFQQESHFWRRVLSIDEIERFRLAGARGYMDGITDVEGAETASMVLDDPDLRAIALVLSIEPETDGQKFDAFRTALSTCRSVSPFLLYGALLTYQLERHAEAEQAYRRALEMDPSDARPWLALGHLLHRHLKRYSEAEHAYRRTIDLCSEIAHAWLGLGKLLTHHLDRHDEAEQAYQRAVTLDPNFAEAWDYLGNLLHYRLKRYDESEMAYRKAIEIDPAFATAWDGLGAILHELERHDEAEAAYRKAIELDSEHALSWSHLGSLLQHLGRYEEAEEAHRKAIEIDASQTYHWDGLGRLLSHLSRNDEAEQVYRKAVEIDPDDPFPRSGLGNLLRDLSRLDEAEEAYRGAVEVDAEHWFAWQRLGDIMRSLGRNSEAEQAYRKAVEINPRLDFAWHSLGELMQELKRYPEAEQAYRKAIDLDSNVPYFWSALGDLLRFHLERHGEAEIAYRRAIDLDPQNGLDWYFLGDVLAHLDRPAEAEHAHRTATELAPSCSFTWNALAWLRYSLGNIDQETESAARKAADLAPDDHHALHTLATILAHRGLWSEAEPLARRFLGEGSAEFHEQTWPDLLTFFREAVRTGHAADALGLLDDLGLGERWRPLREAMAAIAAGTRAYLRRIAPEVRQPAEQLLDALGATDLPERT